MAGLNRGDPDAIHAVIVGLEKYPKAIEMTLAGAAGNAVRFARWLREGGVPKENITLLLSVLDENEAAVASEAKDADLAWRRVGTADDIRTVFVEELASVPGELLYVYWGGHGIMGRNGAERLLFTPDAWAADLRCVAVEDLRLHLIRDDLPGFTQQVFFIDACAAFEEQYQLDQPPVPVPFPRHGRGEVEQFVLYAARDGQEAEQDLTAGTGLFTSTVLDWLEDRAPHLRPDLTLLEQHVRTWFEDRYANGSPSTQTPTAYHYRALDNGAQFDTTFARVDAAALGQVRDTLCRHLKDDTTCLEYVDRLVDACGPLPPAVRDPMSWFARALLHKPRAMAGFVEALTNDGAKEKVIQAFLTLALRHGSPGLLSPREYADLRALLAQWPAPLPPAVVNTLTQASASRCGVQVTADGAPALSLPQLMDHIERLEEFPGGRSQVTKGFKVPAVVAFTQYLVSHTGTTRVSYARRKLLEQWGDRVAARLRVEAAELARVKAEAAEWDEALHASRAPARVVVQVYPEGTGDIFTCVVWIDAGTGELSRYAHPDNGVPLSSAQAVGLIGRAARSLTEHDGTEPVVEIVLQHDDILEIPVQAWDGAGGPADGPVLLGVEQQITLRCAPMASVDKEDYRRFWLKKRWSRRLLPDVVYLDESHTVEDPRAMRAYATLRTSSDAARVVVRTGRRAGALLVRTALALGYPVVIWDTEDSRALTGGEFAQLQPEGALHELPERVRSYWAQSHHDRVRHPLRPALLLEDHDRALPPVLSLTRESASEEEASC